MTKRERANAKILEAVARTRRLQAELAVNPPRYKLVDAGPGHRVLQRVVD